MRDPIDKILLTATYSFFGTLTGMELNRNSLTLVNYMQRATEQTSVNKKWTSLRTTLLKSMQELIPQKQIHTKHCLHWVTQIIRKLIRAKYRLHSKLKHNPKPDTKPNISRPVIHSKTESRKAYWAYLENIIDYTSEPNTQDRHTKQKRFWSFIKSASKDSSGISTLRHQLRWYAQRSYNQI